MAIRETVDLAERDAWAGANREQGATQPNDVAYAEAGIKFRDLANSDRNLGNTSASNGKGWNESQKDRENSHALALTRELSGSSNREAIGLSA